MFSEQKVRTRKIDIGGDAPIVIQSMCSIPFSRFDALTNQALSLEKAGCQMIRVAFPSMDDAQMFYRLRSMISVPLVADIHYDYRLAVRAIEAGADKIRINPGNTDLEHLKQVVSVAISHRVPIRVGINSGSLEKTLLEKYGGATAQALAESALNNVRKLEQCDFDQIVVSMKSSDVRKMVDAYRIFAAQSPYPLHLGVTEAGTAYTGCIKSAAGIGSLLLDGIGDTVRVSLSASPLEEVRAAKTLLRSLELSKDGIEVISCPTCGRTTVNVCELANRVEETFGDIKAPVKIAVMGCVVNGPGEAAQADIGVTGAAGEYVLFEGNTVIRHISSEQVLPLLRERVTAIAKEKYHM